MLAVESSALAEALTHTKVGRHNYPILSGVRLVAADGRLSCWRTDLTVTVEAFAPISKGDLDVVVPAGLLASYAQKVDGPLNLGVVDGRLVVEAARSHVALPTMNVDDWPLVDHTDGDTVALDEQTVAAISTVAYAVATDAAAKLPLTGVHFTGERVEATDSYRLARAACTVPPCLVPHAALVELEPGEITVTDRSVTFSTEKLRRTVRTIDGDFPKTDGFFGEQRPEFLRADRLALLGAVKVAQLAAQAEGSGRLVALEPKDGMVTVASRGVEAESAARVDAECSFDFRVGVNAPTFSDLLAASDAETVELRFVNELKPMWMAGAHGSEHVLMPVRLLG